MEKTDSGCVFRNSMQEQKASRGYNNEKQKRMEKIYLNIQKEFENSAQQRGLLSKFFFSNHVQGFEK